LNGPPAETEVPPRAPFKRYEIRIGPVSNALWVTIDDMTLYKGTARPEECFYVDLLPGKHPVRVHGKAGQSGTGLGVQLHVSELSDAGPWWYEVFEYDCGGAGWCSLQDVRDEQARIKGVPRGIWDKCGSTRVRELDWRTGTMPDAIHPDEILVDFTLHAYKFRTEHPPGSDSCK
jgi:hypothetical protein